jgi:two-component system nitrate/nitrite response regulator NarL
VTAAPVIRIFIIEDHAIVRAGLRMLIENQPGMEVVAESAKATDALKVSVSPDIILLDLDLGDQNGLDHLPALLATFAPAKVLVLTATPETETQMRAAASGARGIVMKEQAPEILVEAIRSVHSGEAWLGKSLMTALLNRLSRSNSDNAEKNPEREKIALLTPREREIVSLIAKGLNGARMAQQLGISEATVRNHLTSILSKLELANKFELAVYAFNHGLTAVNKYR